MKKNMYSTSEVASILHLSRVEVFRKIKAGKIKAQKIGRNFIIPYESIEEIWPDYPTKEDFFFNEDEY